MILYEYAFLNNYIIVRNFTQGQESESDDSSIISYQAQPVPPAAKSLPIRNDKYEDSLDQMKFQFISDEINQIEDINDRANITIEGEAMNNSK